MKGEEQRQVSDPQGEAHGDELTAAQERKAIVEGLLDGVRSPGKPAEQVFRELRDAFKDQ